MFDQKVKAFCFKKPWLYSRWGSRDTFQKSGFHGIWCENILKLPMGHIFEVPELFFHWPRAIFLKISHMRWNLDFFAILAKYVAGVATKYQKMLWGTENRCLKVQVLRKICFDLFWPVFDLFTYNLTLFLACQKNLGGSVQKKNFKPNSDSSHAKPDIEAKNSTYFG